MQLIINPDLKFKYKRTLQRKFKEMNKEGIFDFENLKNIDMNLITIDEFLQILFSKLSTIDAKYAMLSEDILSNKHKFEIIKNYFNDLYGDLWDRCNEKLFKYEFLFYWSELHEQILDNFINSLNNDDEFKNILNTVGLNYFYYLKFADRDAETHEKLFIITQALLTLIDPKFYIFSPVFIVTKSTFKILDNDYYENTISSAESFDLERIQVNILTRLAYINNFVNNQQLFISTQKRYFRDFYKKVYWKYYNYEKTEEIIFSLYNLNITRPYSGLMNSFIKYGINEHITNDIYKIERLTGDIISNIENIDEVPYRYNLGYYYFISFQLKIKNNILKFYNHYNDLTLRIEEIDYEYFQRKIQKIHKFLNISKRDIYYSSWSKYCEIRIFKLRNTGYSLNQLLHEFIKPLSIIQKLYDENSKNKKINYRIKKI